MDAIEHKLAYVIGQPFHCDNSPSSAMRLNYSFPSIEQIDEGIKRLAEMIRKVTQKAVNRGYL